MASRKQLVPSEIQTVQSLPTIGSGFIGFGAKANGLYMKTEGVNGIEYKILTLNDGNLILSGSTTPSNSIGNLGDYYINNTDWTIYGPKFSTLNGPGEGDAESWGTPTYLRGQSGNMWYTGTSTPLNTQYNNGDFYLKSNGTVYTKINNVWVISANLKGDNADISFGVDGGTASSVYGGTINYDFGNASTI